MAMPGEQIISACEAQPGMIVSPDVLSRNPDNIYLVTEIGSNAIVKGVYVGPDEKRCKENESIMGKAAGNLVWFPHATLNLHGEL